MEAPIATALTRPLAPLTLAVAVTLAAACSRPPPLQTEGFAAERSLYLSVADEVDIVESLRPLVAALDAHAPDDLTWWFEPMPDEHHHTIYHPATLRALRLIFGDDGRE
ncbi:hypothetical protein DB30_04267 [Enhygromyxa salina]|uniref:Uncharacterized protein n=1 Tax=Enhygromyxa salina TaxID=215803 RepID=A0A0C1ZZQ2_9BACT|nr:hypothetical protein [Enhygromyxa salina]KIG16648.1 hypothetical protein DB30_04267 [Enhygromyxa salina]